ncbi:phosphatase PAP2 family protein [Halobacillus litoralis]|uniref:phosphatase PAP2 family protein n=1 Tax=Halobacillus litoralis TaxID=45668 RepID=UPI001CD63350|nr:phosphatase PAP2 family protein [Halobacillus litoralis]MCA0970499.1 phosphatase PAP2 family protein [Halobacillus litoralis]
MLFQGTHIKNPSKMSIALILSGFATVFVAFYLFLSLAEEVWENEKFQIDETVNQFIASFNTPGLTNTMGYITETGSVMWLTIATVLVAAYLFFLSDKSNWVVLFLAINMLGISGLTKGLKLLFERQRPSVIEEFDGTGYSFPSGHSTGAVTFYGFMIYLVVVSRLSKGWKWAINSFLAVWALLVALSRVFIGVHFITDIMAGIAIGLSWLLVCIAALEVMLWRKRRFKNKQDQLKMTSSSN